MQCMTYCDHSNHSLNVATAAKASATIFYEMWDC